MRLSLQSKWWKNRMNIKLEINPLWFIVYPVEIVGLTIMFWQLGFLTTFGILLFVAAGGIHHGHVYK